MNGLLDSSPTGCHATDVVDSFRTDVKALPYLMPAGEQISLRFPPTPVLTQSFQQCGTERQIPILGTLSLAYMNSHSPTIDIAHFESDQFGTAHSRGIQRHYDRTVEQIVRCIDHAAHLFQAENNRETPVRFGIGKVIGGYGRLRTRM
jgi:hypothetical protein